MEKDDSVIVRRRLDLSRKPFFLQTRAILSENVDLFPADIKKLPGLAEDNAVTRSIIANYQKKIKADSEPG